MTDRLSEYLDDELSPAERADVEAHVRTCGECRTVLEQLRAVVAQAASMPAAPPASDLWPGIEARLEPRTTVRPFRQRASRQFSFTLPQLVAAAAALVIVSGGGVWLSQLGGPATSLPPLAATVNAPAADAGRGSGTPAASAVEPASSVDPRYDEAISDLEQALDAGRSQLDPETIRILETSLRAIDQAIDQSRQALEADPANIYLHSHLAEARQRKLALLRRASALVTKG